MKQIKVPLKGILAAVPLAVVALVLAVAGGLPRGVVLAAPPPQDGRSFVPLQAPIGAGRTVQVSGSAVVNVVPDRASIQLGVQSNAASIAEVERDNSAAIQNVRKALAGLGVAERDIATDRYVIQPIYENYDSLRIRGYRIDNLVAVTLRDVELTSPAVAAALAAGANHVVDVSFYTSWLREYRDQARALAMQAAGEKASALAGAAGARAGAVLTINENTWSSFSGMWGSRGMSQMTQNVVQNVAPSGVGGSGPEDEPISLGQIAIHAEVSATFSLQ